jgi:hypothetical protein
VFKKIECVCIYSNDLELSLNFYSSMGLTENWKIERILEDGSTWTIIGLKFPQADSSELVLSNNPENNFTEIEILVEDVRDVYAELSNQKDVNWIRTPFATESGHVAVMEAPDKNVFVLVGK